MNKYTKLFISILILLISGYKFFYRDITFGIFLFLLSIIPIFFFFKNEFLILALLKSRKGGKKSMIKWLQYIKNPKLQLIQSQEAYYYFLKGIANSELNINQSESDLRTALKIGLKFKYNEAIANLNLAMITASKGSKKEAELFLNKSKKLDKLGLIEDQIKIMKEQLKRMNIGRNAHNPYIRKTKKII